MKKYEIDCFKVTESYDRDFSVVAYASSETVANQIANKQKNYRSVLPHRQTIIIFDTLAEFEGKVDENLRATALAKLTDAEKAILGVSIKL